MGVNNNDNIIKVLTEELTRLLNYVEKTRQGLENVEDTVMVGSETFPQASVQIKAVAGDLETAANTIMTILEEILSEHDRSHALINSLAEWASGLDEEHRAAGEAIISELKSINAKTKQQMMEIFTNMSFHDLSGQKLKKVTSSLSVVQAKLQEIASCFGIGHDDDQTPTVNFNGITTDPMDQDVVDQLLKDLGT